MPEAGTGSRGRRLWSFGVLRVKGSRETVGFILFSIDLAWMASSVGCCLLVSLLRLTHVLHHTKSNKREWRLNFSQVLTNNIHLRGRAAGKETQLRTEDLQHRKIRECMFILERDIYLSTSIKHFMTHDREGNQGAVVNSPGSFGCRCLRWPP